MLGSRTQDGWRRAIMHERAVDPNLKFAKASAAALLNAWERMMEELCSDMKEPAGETADSGASVPDRVIERSDVVVAGVGGGGDPDGPDGDEDADELDAELSKQWEDIPAPGDLAEPAAMPAAKPLPVRAPAPAPKPAQSPKPAPPVSAPKAAPKIDWGKLGAAAKGQIPASVSKAGPKVFKADAEGKSWRTQCDCRVTRGKVNGCRDRFCDFGGRA